MLACQRVPSIRDLRVAATHAHGRLLPTSRSKGVGALLVRGTRRLAEAQKAGRGTRLTDFMLRLIAQIVPAYWFYTTMLTLIIVAMPSVLYSRNLGIDLHLLLHWVD